MTSYHTHYSASTYYKKTQSYTSYLDLDAFWGTAPRTRVIYNTRSATASTEYSEKWDSTSYTFVSVKAGFGDFGDGNLALGAGFDVNYQDNGITLGSGYISTSVFETWALSSTGTSQSAGRTSYRENSAGHDGALGGGASSNGYTFTGSSSSGRTQTTYQKTYDGKTTISSAFPITLTDTETYNFTTLFWQAGTAPISGSASATRLKTATYTQTLAGSATVYLYGGKFYAPYIQNVRQRPPPLRTVAPVLAVTESSVLNSAYAMQPVSGSIFSGIENFFKSTTLSTTGQIISGSSTTRTAWTALENGMTSSYVLFSVTNISSSFCDFGLGAQRRKIASSEAFFTEASQSIFPQTMIEPSGLSSVPTPWFVPAFKTPDGFLKMPRIFTTLQTAQIDGSSASVRWLYSSGTWKIVITKSNSSTSSTLTGKIDFSGTSPTTTAVAVTGVGNTFAVLGPAIPLSFSSFNQISVTLKRSETDQNSASVFFANSGRNGTVSFEDATFSSTFNSSVYTFGSGSAWARLTYPDSSLSAYKNRRAVSFSTASTTTQFSTMTLPPTTAHAKLNEAGRSDPVAVDQ